MINATGSTGKSAHAVETSKVSKSEVKQRVMLIGQCEGDINVEIQKRGRINRTGQIKLPIYEYIFSDIPCEKKLAMSMRRKLKSLTSNTSSDQNASTDLSDIDDFDNQYGKDAVIDYFDTLNKRWISGDDEAKFIIKFLGITQFDSGLVRTFFSRIQALDIAIQEDIWLYIKTAYEERVKVAKAEGTYFLETQEKQFDAKLISEYCLYEGDSDNSRLTSPTFIGHYDIKSQKQLVSSADIDSKKYEDIAKGIIESIKKGYDDEVFKQNSNLTEALNKANERLNDEITKLQEKISLKKETLNMFLDDDDVNPEKLKKIKEELAALKAELKQKKDNFDAVYEERTNEVKKEHNERLANAKIKMQRLTKAVEKLKVGSVFANESGDYYIVTEISGTKNYYNEEMYNDFFSAPSGINVTLATTNCAIGNSLARNLAEDGLTFLENNILNQKKVTLKDWDTYIRSSKFREKVYIVTGNIIPVINGVNKGTIVKFSKADGTSEIGFLVQMKKNSNTGLMELPETFDGVTVNIEGNEKKIKSALANGGTFDLENKSKDLVGGCSIYGERTSDTDFKYILKMSPSHFNIIKVQGDYISGDYFHTVDNIDDMLKNLALKDYKVKLPFHLLTQYGLTLSGDKYKMKDWTPLSYDKNKIPK